MMTRIYQSVRGHTHTHIYGDPDGRAYIEVERRELPLASTRRRQRGPYGRRVATSMYYFMMRRINQQVPEWEWTRRRKLHDANTVAFNRKWRGAGWAA